MGSFRLLLRCLLLLVCLGTATTAAAARAHHESSAKSPHTFSVTATAYNCVRGQTDRTPLKGAWGDRLDKLPPGVRAVAVSGDLYRRGLKRHERIRIKGLPGEFIVVDRTHRRWKNRIDIYMGKDVRAARRWGKRKVEVTWLRGGGGTLSGSR